MSEQSTLRPLKRKSGGGIQEMTDADIQDLCGYIIGSYLVTNSVYGAASGVGPSGWIQFNQPVNDFYYTTEFDVVDSGTINNRQPSFLYSGYPAGTVGAHPVLTSDNTSVPTGVLLTKTITKSLSNFLTARPVTYLKDSDLLFLKAPYTWIAPANGFPSYRIMEMTDQMIVWYIGSAITAMMSAGGIGGYYLSLTSSPPAGGTWVEITPRIYNTYASVNGVVTESYSLWRKSSGTAGTIRPLKRSGANLVEMTDTEIQNMWPCVGEYIRQTTGSTVRGIGSYYVSVTAPTTGTWVSRGTFVDTTNDLVDTAYNGTFTGSYVGTYSRLIIGNFTGAYSKAFTGAWAGTREVTYGSPAYTNAWTQAFSGSYAGSYTNIYTGISYSGLSYTGYYAGSTYTGYYLSPGSTTTTWGNTGGRNPQPIEYSTSYAQTPVEHPYTATWAGTYTATWTATWTRAWTGSYAGSYTGFFTAIYTSGFTAAYTGSYTGIWTGAFTGFYNQAFTGSFSGFYTGSYTKAFSGLTVQSTTNSITYTLWVRTA